MKNQSVVENYWAVKLWVMRPDRAQRKVFWWFCLFSSISKSKRVLCLRQRAERGGWESLTADASTPGDTEPDMLGLRGGGKVQAMYSLSWTCLQPYIFLSWFPIKWHWQHVEPTYDSLLSSGKDSQLTQTITREIFLTLTKIYSSPVIISAVITSDKWKLNRVTKNI